MEYGLEEVVIFGQWRSGGNERLCFRGLVKACAGDGHGRRPVVGEEAVNKGKTIEVWIWCLNVRGYVYSKQINLQGRYQEFVKQMLLVSLAFFDVVGSVAIVKLQEMNQSAS